jgi:hypothetical protein
MDCRREPHRNLRALAPHLGNEGELREEIINPSGGHCSDREWSERHGLPKERSKMASAIAASSGVMVLPARINCDSNGLENRWVFQE